MQQATIIGTATSTIKHSSLQGSKLLVAQPIQLTGLPDGSPIVVVDLIGAGIGQNVIITSDGKYLKETLNNNTTPLRWSVVGIVD
ncbi:MAG TPA: EutN/CcmL family microcompartment protein [Pirellulaceae bacterium]|mgnify:CR=1 FL=1|nr:EutN/CcmL family microcompartment protein [Pirellulaceae bacterium]HMO91438.1 EutN/CcmL family microcompartment protein [Pirellulaceae bacterium]HMP69485.1 EutN/CcmL family microcompartment protein [Pirellulaceae bacterium]